MLPSQLRLGSPKLCCVPGTGGSGSAKEATLQLRAVPQQRVPAQLPAAPRTRGRGGPAGVADARPVSDCRHHLCEPDMKLVWPSAKLLQAAAGASLRTYHRLTRSVLPLLLEQYTKHSQVRGTPQQGSHAVGLNTPGCSAWLGGNRVGGHQLQWASFPGCGWHPPFTLWPPGTGLRRSWVPAVTESWVMPLCPCRAARGGQSWKCCWASWSCSRSGDMWKKVRLAGPSGGTHVPPLCPWGLLALPSPSPALTENKSSLTWAAVVQPTCLRQGSCMGGWV